MSAMEKENLKALKGKGTKRTNVDELENVYDTERVLQHQEDECTEDNGLSIFH